MLSASPHFLASLRTSHVVTIEAELHMPGEDPVEVPVQGGSLVLDRTARMRRTGHLDLPWTIELARLGLSVDVRLLPFGSYVRLARGIRYGDGSRETVQVGYLRCESVGWRTHEDTAGIELADRMAQVADEALISPYNASGKKPSQAAIELATAVFGASISYSSTVPAASEPTLADVIYTGDRAEAIANLALVVGAEAFFDHLGDFHFDPVPAVSASPVWTIDAGDEGVMIAADEALDRTRVYNGVFVEGQASGSDPPVSALVVDSTPSSLTYWGGPFGKVARVETSAAVQTVAQAQTAAQALLANQLGLERQLRVSMLPNPLLLPGDTVLIVFPDESQERHLVEALTLPLDAVSPTEIVCRTVWTPTSISTFEGTEAYLELQGAAVA